MQFALLRGPKAPMEGQLEEEFHPRWSLGMPKLFGPSSMVDPAKNARYVEDTKYLLLDDHFQTTRVGSYKALVLLAPL
jgi:hypothetical protein